MIPKTREIKTCQARWFTNTDYLGLPTPTGIIYVPVLMMKWSSISDNQVTFILEDKSQHVFKFNDNISYQTIPTTG